MVTVGLLSFPTDVICFVSLPPETSPPFELRILFIVQRYILRGRGNAKSLAFCQDMMPDLPVGMHSCPNCNKPAHGPREVEESENPLADTM